VKEACRTRYADWNPTLRAFTQEADDDSIYPRDLFMLPIGHSWKHVPGITLVGDASHVMTPFAGEGVNLAFSDVIDLSKAILSAAAEMPSDATTTSQATAGSPLDDKIRAFETAMFARATEFQQQTYDMMSAMFLIPGAPRQGIEKYILRATEGELGTTLSWLLTPLVYAYFFVFKLIW